MLCIFCSSDTKVINSRHQKLKNCVWRRRQCIKCGKTVTSIEKYDWSRSVLVFDEADSAEFEFERDKLFLSIYKTLKHRQSALSDAKAICETVMSKLDVSDNGKISRAKLRSETYTVLKRFDSPAAIYYKSFHKM